MFDCINFNKTWMGCNTFWRGNFVSLKKYDVSFEELSFKNVVPEQLIEGFLDYSNLNNNIASGKVIRDFFLYHGITIDQLSYLHCKEYLEYLKRVQIHYQTATNTLKKKYKLIVSFINYLYQYKYIDFQLADYYELKKRNIEKKKKVIKPKKIPIQVPLIIKDFIVFLKSNGYMSVHVYQKRILCFSRFLRKEGLEISVFLEKNKEALLFEKISSYEEMLSDRITKEELQKVSVTSDRRTVKLFVEFLISEGLISKEYIIPKYLRGRSKRTNEYVPKEMIIKMMNAIYERSNNELRDLSIFLLIVDTGCRPIEIANCTLDDLDLIEGTLRLSCGKTKPRKVKLSVEVLNSVKDYLKVRDNYNPISDSLFSVHFGKGITSSSIHNIFYNANIRAFGESKYPPKALRHTYITNALDQYSFERVSKAIGHEDWKSTYYYLYRSNKLLLKKTLTNSPFNNEGCS